MKVIIAGSRNMPRDLDLIDEAVKDSGFAVEAVVCGCARGADTWGAEWAKLRDIPILRFPAEWDKYGRAAGPIRNSQMRDAADALIVFIYPGSRGSINMLEQMERVSKPVYVVWDGKLGLKPYNGE